MIAMKTIVLLCSVFLTLTGFSQQVIIQQQTTTTTTTSGSGLFQSNWNTPAPMQGWTNPGFFSTDPSFQISTWGMPGNVVVQTPPTQVTYYTDPYTGQVYVIDQTQEQYYIDQWGNYIPVQQQQIIQQQPVFPQTQIQFQQNPGFVPQVQQCQPVPQNVFNPVTMVPDVNQFSMMIQHISQQSFDSNRLQVAQQIVSANRLTSAQVTDIARLFSFESTRLDFVKFAYPYVVDPGSYFMVNNAFTFSSSVDELNRFLTGMR